MKKFFEFLYQILNVRDYYTDGLRVVLVLAEERVALDSISHLPWERPAMQKIDQPSQVGGKN